MKTFDPAELHIPKLQNLLQYAIAPRPIALVSTISGQGKVNLSPFSFFNLFSANPPIVIFSPSRRVRDNTTKHTWDNLYDYRECVVNIVDYAMLSKVSQASADYPKEINEFTVVGLTELASESVRPPRVAESPVQLECKVNHMMPLGKGPGAGNLVIAEIIKIHYREDLLDQNDQPLQQKFDHVARLGGDWYCRVTPDNLFQLPKPGIIGVLDDLLNQIP